MYFHVHQVFPRRAGTARALAERVDARLKERNFDLALELVDDALRDAPGDTELIYLRGRVFQSQGEWQRARDCYAEVTRFAPAKAEAWNNLGCMLQALGVFEEAHQAFLRAVVLRPDLAQAHNNLGVLEAGAGRLDEACDYFRRAIGADADFAEAQFNLGRAPTELGRAKEAAPMLQRASELEPRGRLDVFLALSVPEILDSAGQAHDIRAAMRQRLDKLGGIRLEDPPGSVELSWFYLAYHGIDDTQLNRRITDFFSASCPDLAFEAPHCRRSRRPRERLRIGFISRHLYDHSIGRTTRGVVPRLSRKDFEVHAIFVAPVTDDAVHREIKAGADGSIVVPDSLPAARRAIAALELDILFYQDLGMDAFTYFLAFSRLAPTQCVGWGHPVSPGLETIDAFLSTEDFEPPSAESHYNERLLKMSGIATPSYYFRPDSARATLTRQQSGFEDSATAYFCPQTLFKLHPDFDAALAEILFADRDAVLYLLEDRRSVWTERVRERLERRFGRASGRFRFLPRHPGVEHYFSRLKHADVILDTFHFGGGNTSLEAFAFGAPVVTWPGEFMRGRHTLGMYRRMGIGDAIASSPSEYARIAVDLGTDRARREVLRGRIMERSAVLYEDDNVVRELERVLKQAALRA